MTEISVTRYQRMPAPPKLPVARRISGELKLDQIQFQVIQIHEHKKDPFKSYIVVKDNVLNKTHQVYLYDVMNLDLSINVS